MFWISRRHFCTFACILAPKRHLFSEFRPQWHSSSYFSFHEDTLVCGLPPHPTQLPTPVHTSAGNTKQADYSAFRYYYSNGKCFFYPLLWMHQQLGNSPSIYVLLQAQHTNTNDWMQKLFACMNSSKMHRSICDKQTHKGTHFDHLHLCFIPDRWQLS